MTYYTGADLARSFRTVRQNTLQIASHLDEAQYGFRATPDTRTAAEILAHIAAGTRWPHQLHAVEKKTFVPFADFARLIAESGVYAASLRTKSDIVNALQTNGQQFATWLESLSDSALGEMVSFPPPVQPAQKSRFEMILGVKEHEMHHRAQLMVMQRLLGIVPHLTREREARMARPT